jgi:predicted dehydrogenase
MQVKTGIIGGGAWGSLIREKIEALSSDIGLELCFVAGRNDNFIELCQDHGIHWALVAAPTPKHRLIVEQLLDDGRNVFCTKPLTENGSDSSLLINLAKEKGCRFYIDDVFTYNPGFASLQRDAGKDIRIYWNKWNGREFASVADVLFRLFYHDRYLAQELIGEHALKVRECEVERCAFYLRAECGDKTLEMDYRMDRSEPEEHRINGVDFTHRAGQGDPLQQMLLAVLTDDFDQQTNNERGLWCNLRIDELLGQIK